MRTIALVNQKGGVAKTTSTVNIGAGLAILNKKVLLIDLDPQAACTNSLGIAAHELPYSVFEVLTGKVSLADATVVRPIKYHDANHELKVVPANLSLSGADMELASTPGRERLLLDALDGLSDIDYILIDCPPSLGLLTLNALTAAREIFIPVQVEFLALTGVAQLLQTIEVAQKRLNKKLTLTGVIATRYDSRLKLNREVVERMQQHFGQKVFKTFIRDNVAVAEAPSHGQTIFEYQPGSHGAKDYLALCKEIIKMEGRS